MKRTPANVKALKDLLGYFQSNSTQLKQLKAVAESISGTVGGAEDIADYESLVDLIEQYRGLSTQIEKKIIKLLTE